MTPTVQKALLKYNDFINAAEAEEDARRARERIEADLDNLLGLSEEEMDAYFDEGGDTP
jgi:hypothetical protein